MNKPTLTLFLASVCLLFCMCDKADTDETIPAEPDAYYVRYESSYSSNPTSYVTRYISVKTDNGTKKFTTRGTFSETFGPVGKGFEAYIEDACKAHMGTTQVKIYVSRNQEPFVLKAFHSGDVSSSEASKTVAITAKYTIDF